MFGGEYNAGAGMGGGQDFAAMPRLIQGKPKFKDPYGRNIDEYFPQNIMHDRRIQRGSTYAAMVIPAGTNPDAMVMDKSYPKKRTFRQPGGGGTKKTKNIYPNRDIPTPEPVPGRLHMDIQTDPYKEILTDKPQEREQGIATEFYLDRPPVPLFQPKMPSKENCKATQIYAGDDELFNFNEEVEPMLNVLCSKTLEQARMEVLEETELEIMKTQQKEYEEVVNAELVIAQRFEAAEQRCKEEVERRKVQNKARKEEKKAAHMKINARQYTKNYLSGIREQALNQLSSMGVLVAPDNRAIEEEVMPWLMGKIIDFLEEDKATNQGSQNVVIDGILDCQNEHSAVIQAKYDAIKKAEEDAIAAKKANEIRKLKRRELREKRKKDQALEDFKFKVEDSVIFKGEVTSILQTNLSDYHGNYSREAYVGAPGGQILQIYYIIQQIYDKYPQGLKNYMQKKLDNDDDEYFEKPHSARELVLPEHLMKFFMQYIKDMKNESIDIMISRQAMDFLNTLEIPKEDLSTLSDEDLEKFKAFFAPAKRISRFHKDTGKSMDTLYDFLIDILAKRVPIDDFNVKVEQIQSKIRLMPFPDDVFETDYTENVKTEQEDGTFKESVVDHKKNTNEVGLILITVPQVEEEEEIKIEVTGGKEEPKEGEEVDPTAKKTKTKKVTRMVDIDTQDKVISVTTRGIEAMDNKNFWCINTGAAKAYREEFLEYINKTYPEFWEDNDDMDEIIKVVHEQGQKDIDNFVKAECGEYDVPCLTFPVNAAEI